MSNSTIPSQLGSPSPAQMPTATLRQQLLALLEFDESASGVTLAAERTTMGAAKALISSLDEFERTAMRQRKVFLQSLAHRTKPLYLTRTWVAARKLAQRGEWVALFKPRVRDNLISVLGRRDTWLGMVTQGNFLLDERSVFDWSVYNLARALASKLSEGPIADVFPRRDRIIFKWEPEDPKLELPDGHGTVVPLNWEQENSVQLAAAEMIKSVTPILRDWETGIKQLAVMALDASGTFDSLVTSECLRPARISIRAFERFKRQEKQRRCQMEAEREAGVALAL